MLGSMDKNHSSFGKSDATGRSSGKLVGRNARVRKPPKGEPWAWLTRELLTSPSWRSMSVNTARLLHFLLVEHMNHAALENGHLIGTYDQLVSFGLTRSRIPEALEEAQFLGLVSVQRSKYWAGAAPPNIYRLTFYADKDGNPPTQEWKGKTQEAIDAWRTDRTSRRMRKNMVVKKQITSATCGTPIVSLVELKGRKSRGRQK